MFLHIFKQSSSCHTRHTYKFRKMINIYIDYFLFINLLQVENDERYCIEKNI